MYKKILIITSIIFSLVFSWMYYFLHVSNMSSLETIKSDSKTDNIYKRWNTSSISWTLHPITSPDF